MHKNGINILFVERYAHLDDSDMDSDSDDDVVRPRIVVNVLMPNIVRMNRGQPDPESDRAENSRDNAVPGTDSQDEMDHHTDSPGQPNTAPLSARGTLPVSHNDAGETSQVSTKTQLLPSSSNDVIRSASDVELMADSSTRSPLAEAVYTDIMDVTSSERKIANLTDSTPSSSCSTKKSKETDLCLTSNSTQSSHVCSIPSHNSVSETFHSMHTQQEARAFPQHNDGNVDLGLLHYRCLWFIDLEFILVVKLLYRRFYHSTEGRETHTNQRNW